MGTTDASRKTSARVLERLAAAGDKGRPESVSGQQIADDLGLSRNAVWKAVASLREAGYVIDAEPRTGYRLIAAPDPIVPEQVLSRLRTGLFKSIRYLPETDSTNDVAKQLAREGAPEGTVIVADRQRKGRGRRGRAWETKPGQSLLMSAVLRPDIPPRKAPLLVFLAAAAVRAALLPYGPTWIKWPNDVVTEEGRKLSGILVELDAEHDRVRHCIVGIGINVAQRPQDFPSSVRETAASVASIVDKPVRRGPLLSEVLDQFARRYEVAVGDGFDEVLQEMRRHSATLGRAVVVHEPNGETWHGTAVDVQRDGALLVRPTSGTSKRIADGRRVLGREATDGRFPDAAASRRTESRAMEAPVAVYAADVSIRIDSNGGTDK